MKVVAAVLASGLWRALGSVRLILLLTGVNLLFAAVAILPLGMALYRMGAPLGSGSPLADGWPFWFDADFRAHAAPVHAVLRIQAAVMVCLYTGVSAFLSGGALGVLHDADGAFSLGAFLRGAGRYGFRFLRILVLFLAACWMLQWLMGEQLREFRDWMVFDWPSQRGVFFLELGYQALYLLVFYLLAWIFDLARVRLVVEERRSAVGAVLAGVALAVRRPVAVLALFVLLVLAQGVVIGLAGEALTRLPPSSGWGGVGVLFFAAQATMALRFALRLSYLECARQLVLRSSPRRDLVGAAGFEPATSTV